MPRAAQARLQRAGVAARDQTRGATFGKVGGAVDGAETGEQGALADAAFSIGAENLAVIGARGPHFKARGAEYGALLGGEARGDDAPHGAGCAPGRGTVCTLVSPYGVADTFKQKIH